MQKGLYFAYEVLDDFGISFSMVYCPADKDFQICLALGCLALAVGITF